MMYYNDYFPFHMYGFGFIFMILFWGLIVYGAIMLFSRKNGDQNDKDSAIKIARERYAKGEITKEQFETIKKDLQ